MSKLLERISEKSYKALKKSSLTSIELNFFASISLLFIKSKILSLIKMKPNNNKFNIGFILSGGFGDQIISAQWIYNFLHHIHSIKLDFFAVAMFSSKNTGHLIAENMPFLDLITDRKYLNTHKFDLLINCDQYIRIESYNKYALIKHSTKLSQLIKHSIESNNELYKYANMIHQYQLMHYCIAKKWNRYDLLGNAPLCSFGRNSETYWPDYSHERNIILNKYSLLKIKYITIHTGAGGMPDGSDPKKATKCLNLDFINSLVKSLKRIHTDILFVQIGDINSSHEIRAVDKCLIRGVPFRDSLVILEQALFHIDNDAGLIHARHAMAKTSAVFWGPTDVRFLGYENDLNFTSTLCSHPCMWLSDNWNSNCILGYKVGECMKSFDINQTVELISQKILELKKNSNQ